MERLPGETLADRTAAGPVEQAWLERVAGDVLGALDAAHAAGIVHRDIKPGNILLASDGCAKVADFGIAKSAEAVAGDVTAVGLLLGTPAYLAPERLAGHPATPRSDLFALGVVLYEALSGEAASQIVTLLDQLPGVDVGAIPAPPTTATTVAAPAVVRPVPSSPVRDDAGRRDGGHKGGAKPGKG